MTDRHDSDTIELASKLRLYTLQELLTARMIPQRGTVRGGGEGWWRDAVDVRGEAGGGVGGGGGLAATSPTMHPSPEELLYALDLMQDWQTVHG